MPLIYLIRHGRPRFSDDLRRFLGRTNLPLSQNAWKELLPASNYLSDKGITAVFTSPLVRCVQTAKIIFGSNVRHTICPELVEINMGGWEMKTRDEIESIYPGEYQRRGQDMAAYRPPGGESFLDVQKRAVSALQKLARESAEPIAVVAHAGVNRCVLCAIQGRSLSELFDIRQPYGCINVLRCDSGGLRFVTTLFLQEVWR